VGIDKGLSFVNWHYGDVQPWHAPEAGIDDGQSIIDWRDALHAESGAADLAIRVALCWFSLFPPALLVGASLASVARWALTSPRGACRQGLLYGGHLAGAGCGCVLVGFYLLPVHDRTLTVLTAAAVSGGVALVCLCLAVLSRGRRAAPLMSDARPGSVPGRRTLHLAAALSGTCALVAVVVWTRLLSICLGGTVYTYSIILAVFLGGPGLGGVFAAGLARGAGQARRLQGICQLLLAGAVAWAAFQLAVPPPWWAPATEPSAGPWVRLQLEVLNCLWVLLPAAALWGASLSLALAGAVAPGQDPGRLAGGVLAASAAGAALGAGGGPWLIAALGTQHVQQLLVGVSAFTGLVLLIPVPMSIRAGAWPGRKGLAWRVLPVAATAVLAVLVAAGIPENGIPGAGELLFLGEGDSVSVAVSRRVDTGVRSLYVNGRVAASTEPQELRRLRLLGHLPALVHPQPRSVLVVGCGAGITAGVFVLHPGVERLVVCEPEPLLPQAADRYFASENNEVFRDPRVAVAVDDARHYIRTTTEHFDIILVAPPPPSAKGAAAFYTNEFFRHCFARLDPGGVFALGFSLDRTDADTVKCALRTFLVSYFEGTAWCDNVGGPARSLVLLCQNSPMTAYPVHVNALRRRLQRPDHARVLESLRGDSFGDELDVLETYGARLADLVPWLGMENVHRAYDPIVHVAHTPNYRPQDQNRLPLNYDRNLRLQFLAGRALDRHQAEAIYQKLVSYRRFDEVVFLCPAATRAELNRRWDRSSPISSRGR
jgi:spermidine synthase